MYWKEGGQSFASPVPSIPIEYPELPRDVLHSWKMQVERISHHFAGAAMPFFASIRLASTPHLPVSLSHETPQVAALCRHRHLSTVAKNRSIEQKDAFCAFRTCFSLLSPVLPFVLFWAKQPSPCEFALAAPRCSTSRSGPAPRRPPGRQAKSSKKLRSRTEATENERGKQKEGLGEGLKGLWLRKGLW